MRRWDEAMDVAVHLHDQVRSGRLPYSDGPATIANVAADAEQLFGPQFAAQFRELIETISFALPRAEPVFVSPEIDAIWRDATAGFHPEAIQMPDPFALPALVLLPQPLEIDGAENDAVLWQIGAIDRNTDTPRVVIWVVGFTQRHGRWGLGSWDALPVDVEPSVYGREPDKRPRVALTEVNETDRSRQLVAQLSLWQHVQALWRLARTFVTQPERAPRPSRRAAKRARLEHDEQITVIRLRRLSPGDSEPEHTVDWSCRWMVRGHWRHLSDGRQTYVHPHVKGPQDKPFRQTDRIFEFVR